MARLFRRQDASFSAKTPLLRLAKWLPFFALPLSLSLLLAGSLARSLAIFLACHLLARQSLAQILGSLSEVSEDCLCLCLSVSLSVLLGFTLNDRRRSTRVHCSHTQRETSYKVSPLTMTTDHCLARPLAWKWKLENGNGNGKTENGKRKTENGKRTPFGQFLLANWKMATQTWCETQTIKHPNNPVDLGSQTGTASRLRQGQAGASKFGQTAALCCSSSWPGQHRQRI